MTYAQELDDLPAEVRKDASGLIRLWPKVPGVGNVSVTGSPAYTVHDPSGVEISSGTITPTDVDGVDLLSIPIPALSVLDEDYSARVSWVYGGVTYFDQILFDVVLYPYSWPTVALNDLQEERPDIAQILDKLGDYVGQTAEQMAAIYGYRARVELDAAIRNQVRQDRDSGTRDYESAGSSVRVSSASRPALILNRARLAFVERKIAMKLIFLADSVNPEEDGGDESGALYRRYKADSEMAWETIGPLKYDSSEDLVPDLVITDPTTVVYSRRVQS